MTSAEVREDTFQKILVLCDITERMLMAVEAPEVKNKKELLEILTPVAQKVNEAVQVVTETFIDHIKHDEQSDKQRSLAVDTAIKGMYDALRAMKEKGEQLAEHIEKETQNATA